MIVCLAAALRLAQSPLLSDYLSETYVPANHQQPGSIDQKSYAISVFSHYLARPARLVDLNRETLNGFVTWYLQRQEPATVAAKRSKLLTLWRAAFEEGLVPELPHRIKTVRIPEKVPEGWILPELQQIFTTIDRLEPSKFDARPQIGGCCRRLFFRAFAWSFLSHGLRLSAGCSVRRRDVRADLTFTVRYYEQKTWVEQTKQFLPQAWEAIRALGEHEFCLPYGQTKAQRRRIGEWWKHILREAGLDASRGTGPQQLRRTAASFKELQEPGSMQEFLGHKTPGLGKRRYEVRRIVRPNRIAPPQFDFS